MKGVLDMFNYSINQTRRIPFYSSDADKYLYVNNIINTVSLYNAVKNKPSKFFDELKRLKLITINSHERHEEFKNSTKFILGAIDSEMNFIAFILKYLDLKYEFLRYNGKFVNSYTAYVAKPKIDPNKVNILIEVNSKEVANKENVIIIDHHNPGDPGYDAVDYTGSSVYQLYNFLSNTGIYNFSDEMKYIIKVVGFSDHNPSLIYKNKLYSNNLFGVYFKDFFDFRFNNLLNYKINLFNRRDYSDEAGYVFELKHKILTHMNIIKEKFLDKCLTFDTQHGRFIVIDPEDSSLLKLRMIFDHELANAVYYTYRDITAYFGYINLYIYYDVSTGKARYKVGILNGNKEVVEKFIDAAKKFTNNFYSNPNRGYCGCYIEDTKKYTYKELKDIFVEIMSRP